MRTSLRHTLSLMGATSLVFAPIAFSADIIPITSFDPNTFFDGGITAGIDFDDGTSSNYPDPTQPGFLSIPASNSKTYNVTTGGITFDINVSNANLGNQNRNRNNVNAGRLITDFEQWYGSFPTATGGNLVEAAVTLTGLTANTDYQVSFFTMNVGAGQTTHKFYEGTSSSAPLITTFTTSGNQNNYAAWVPGITFQINSGGSAEIAVTVQASAIINGENTDSRLGLCGISVISLAPPAARNLNLVITPNGTPGLYDFTWDSLPGKVYDLLSNTDLDTAPDSWPVYMGNADIPAAGASTTLTEVPSDGARRFFVVSERDAPPLLSEDFESGDGGFTFATTAGSDWAYGTPDSSGPGGAVKAGNSGTLCWGTKLGDFTGAGDNGFYAGPSTVTLLRSPVIDLTGVTAATLTFAEALDLHGGDTAVVNIIEELTGNIVAGGAAVYTADDSGETTAAAWATVPAIDLTPFAGLKVRVEWSFTGLGGGTNDYMGWYIDDVIVTETP